MPNLDQELIMTRIILQTRGKWKFKYQELRKTVKKSKRAQEIQMLRACPKEKQKNQVKVKKKIRMPHQSSEKKKQIKEIR